MPVPAKIRSVIFALIKCDSEYTFADFASFISKCRFVFSFCQQYNQLYGLVLNLFGSMVSVQEKESLNKIMSENLNGRAIESLVGSGTGNGQKIIEAEELVTEILIGTGIKWSGRNGGAEEEEMAGYVSAQMVSADILL
ncbi:Hypothetical_protein [Hexamita inflata]|uniref:Hypothetical_protein n=1 Tax=Hexamita inflata TaxID=28002 RepID=A0AA86PTR1_9EUKA|nr:Hypothetical protein HINF_LOCUS32306 [Hexamita inflata]